MRKVKKPSIRKLDVVLWIELSRIVKRATDKEFNTVDFNVIGAEVMRMYEYLEEKDISSIQVSDIIHSDIYK